MHKKVLAAFLCVIALVLIPFSLPVLLAFLTAATLMPLIHLLKRFSIHHEFACWIVFVGLLTTILTASLLLGRTMIEQLTSFIQRLPTFMVMLDEWWMGLIDSLQGIEGFPPILLDLIEGNSEGLLDHWRHMTDRIDISIMFDIAITHLPLFVFNVVFYIVLLLLFMLQFPKMMERFYASLSDQYELKIKHMIERFKHVVIGFLKAQFLVGIPIVIVTFIGLLIIAPEVALIMTLIIWIIDFIPFIGSIVILAPWAMIQFIIGNSTTAIHLLILALILLVIRRTVEPKLMGTQIGLSPLLTLVSMYLGFVAFGPLGFFLGPLLVIIFTTAKEVGLFSLTKANNNT
ncbi:sporulation integral membrane protein YtvI [Geomicrobium sp. JSM 1781026]|uniref:sporulation integral membrane protein YtvI n=1 Tax=Geomicrobium sp. JSM 1781026 TaxID=3344580 RepID=UPI0035C26585